MKAKLKIPLVQISEQKLYYLENANIMLHDGSGEHNVYHITEPILITMARCSKLLVRLLRLLPRGICLSKDRYIIFSLRKRIFIVDVINNGLCGCFSVRENFSNPLNITPDAGSSEFIAYYGDYGGNPERQPVHIYGITKEFLPKVLYTFPQGAVRHVHNMIPDTNGDGYYVLTGDHGNESGIWKFSNDFQSKKVVSAGSQQYRAVQACLLGHNLCYATDAVMEANHIFCIKDMSYVGRAEAIADICGPCIYGACLADGYIFASCVESDESVTGTLKKLFTRKLGKGVKDRFARLYFLSDNKKMQELAKLEKDIWPIKLFQYGTVLFPYVVTSVGKLYCLPIGVKKNDLELSVIEEDNNGYVFRVCRKSF